MTAFRFFDKAKTRLGPRGSGGDWNMDDAVTHGSPDGRLTFCGARIGAESRGWFEVRGVHYPGQIVTCKRCVRTTNRAEVRS